MNAGELCFMGNIDIRSLETGDRSRIADECLGKLNGMKALRASTFSCPTILFRPVSRCRTMNICWNCFGRTAGINLDTQTVKCLGG